MIHHSKWHPKSWSQQLRAQVHVAPAECAFNAPWFSRRPVPSGTRIQADPRDQVFKRNIQQPQFNNVNIGRNWQVGRLALFFFHFACYSWILVRWLLWFGRLRVSSYIHLRNTISLNFKPLTKMSNEYITNGWSSLASPQHLFQIAEKTGYEGSFTYIIPFHNMKYSPRNASSLVYRLLHLDSKYINTVLVSFFINASKKIYFITCHHRKPNSQSTVRFFRNWWQHL